MWKVIVGECGSGANRAAKKQRAMLRRKPAKGSRRSGVTRLVDTVRANCFAVFFIPEGYNPLDSLPQFLMVSVPGEVFVAVWMKLSLYGTTLLRRPDSLGDQFC